MSDKSNINFFAVGCWNRGPIKEQLAVFDEINNRQDEIDILLILGDNVYSNANSYSINEIQQRGLEKKNHSLDIYQKGVQVLLANSSGKKFEKPIYFVLGNHDVSHRQINECEIYKAQLNVHKISKNLFTRFPLYFETINSKDNSTSIKLICLDTNFTELGLDYSKPSCINDNSKRILIKQLETLDEVIRSSIEKNILIMGHHPIVFNKTKFDEKSGSMKNKNIENNIIQELVDILGMYAEHKNITYLCADNHMYQDWTIEYPNGSVVHQIICGTGSAILDTGNNLQVSFTDSNEVTYKRNREINNKYGFVKLSFQHDRVEHIFYEETIDSSSKATSTSSSYL